MLMPTKLLIICFSINAVASQLLLKRGTSGLGGITPLVGWWKFILAAATSPWICAAVTVQGVGYILWVIIVSRVKLGVATASAGAIFYILMALSAWGLFGESLTTAQWFGIILITIGVMFVSMGPIQ